MTGQIPSEPSFPRCDICWEPIEVGEELSVETPLMVILTLCRLCHDAIVGSLLVRRHRSLRGSAAEHADALNRRLEEINASMDDDPQSGS